MVKRILSIALVVMMLTSLFAVNTFAYNIPNQTVETAVFTQDFQGSKIYNYNFEDNITFTYAENDDGWKVFARSWGGDAKLLTADGDKYVTIYKDNARDYVLVPQSIYEDGAKYKVAMKLSTTGGSNVEAKIGFMQHSGNKEVKTKTVTITGTETEYVTDTFTYSSATYGSQLVHAYIWPTNGQATEENGVAIDDVVIYKLGTTTYTSTTSIFANRNFDFDSYPDGLVIDETDAYGTTNMVQNTYGNGYVALETNTKNTATGSGKSIRVGVGGTVAVGFKDVFNGTTDNGKTYTVSMKIYPRTDNANAYLQIGVLNDDSWLQTSYKNGNAWFTSSATLTTTGSGLADKDIVLTPNAWNEVSFNIAPETRKNLVIEGLGQTTNMFIDDMTITEYVEPEEPEPEEPVIPDDPALPEGAVFAQYFNHSPATNFEDNSGFTYVENSKVFARTYDGGAAMDVTNVADKHVTFQSTRGNARNVVLLPQTIFEDGGKYKVAMKLSTTGGTNVTAKLGFTTASAWDIASWAKDVTVTGTETEFVSNEFTYSSAKYGSTKVHALIAVMDSGVTSADNMVTVDDVIIYKIEEEPEPEEPVIPDDPALPEGAVFAQYFNHSPATNFEDNSGYTYVENSKVFARTWGGSAQMDVTDVTDKHVKFYDPDGHARNIVLLPQNIFETGKYYKVAMKLSTTGGKDVTAKLGFTTKASGWNTANYAKDITVTGTETEYLSDAFLYTNAHSVTDVHVLIAVMNANQATANNIVTVDDVIVYQVEKDPDPDSIFISGNIDFEDIAKGYTLSQFDKFHWPGTSGTVGKVVEGTAASGSKSLMLVFPDATHDIVLSDVLKNVDDADAYYKVSMKVYPEYQGEKSAMLQVAIAEDAGASKINESINKKKYTIGDVYDLTTGRDDYEYIDDEGNVAEHYKGTIKNNAWNEISLIAKGNDYDNIRFQALLDSLAIYVDDIVVTPVTTADFLSIEADAAEVEAGVEGIIAYFAEVNEGLFDVASYGMYVYINESNKVELSAGTIADLRAKAGKFNATVTEIGIDDYDTVVVAMPYINIAGTTIYGNVQTMTVAEVLATVE